MVVQSSSSPPPCFRWGTRGDQVRSEPEKGLFQSPHPSCDRSVASWAEGIIFQSDKKNPHHYNQWWFPSDKRALSTPTGRNGKDFSPLLKETRSIKLLKRFPFFFFFWVISLIFLIFAICPPVCLSSAQWMCFCLFFFFSIGLWVGFFHNEFWGCFLFVFIYPSLIVNIFFRLIKCK